MISIQILFFILIVHYVADFILQSSWMAENKSTDMDALIDHTLTYTTAWFLPAFLLLGANGFIFLAITFVCHTMTDYYTSRLTSQLFGKKDYHNGFVVVGADQLLHYFQLVLTYYLLK